MTALHRFCQSNPDDSAAKGTAVWHMAHVMREPATYDTHSYQHIARSYERAYAAGASRSIQGEGMWMISTFARTLGLFGCILVVLTACGFSASPTPTASVNAPALLFFYTDN